MRPVTAIVAILRRLRAERGVTAFLFVLVATTSLLVAAAPRSFERVTDAGLRDGVVRATAAQRNFEFTSVDRIRPGATPFANVEKRAADLWDRIPSSIQRIIGDRRFVVDSPRFGIADPPNYTTFVTFQYQDGLDGRIHYVAGRPPTQAVQPAGADASTRLEIVLAEDAATATKIRLGDTLHVSIDPTDPLVRFSFPLATRDVDAVVVGLFAVDDASADYWYADQRLMRAAVGGTDEHPIAYTTALIAPQAYADLLGLELPMSYRWRFYVDSTRLDVGQLAALVPDLLRLKTGFDAPGGFAGLSPSLRTGLSGVIDRYRTQQATAEAALVVAALGPLAVAGGALALVAILIVRRRRAALLLARGRGASARQLLAAQLAEGLLFLMPAALTGLLIAFLAIPARSDTSSSTGAIGVGLGATAILVLATWSLAHRARRQLERDEPAVRRPSARRLVFETLVIALAATGAWLLRQRGLTSAGAPGDVRTFDPFLALAPVLVGVAVGLVTIRLYPYPIRGLGWLAARRRDIVAVLGLRTIGRDPAGAYLPLLVLMLTVAIGTFTSVVRLSLERGQFEESWRQVGADYRIEDGDGGPLAPRVDPAAIPGVGAVAAGFEAPSVGFVTLNGRTVNTALLAIDAKAYEAVIADSPIARSMPAAFALASTGSTAGTVADPIPAVVSSQAPAGTSWPGPGDEFALKVLGKNVSFRVEEVADTFPGIPNAGPFVVAPLRSLAAAAGSGLRPTVDLVRGDAALGPVLRAGLAAQSATATVDSRHERYAAVHDAPLVAGVVAGFGLALVIALVYATLGIVAAVLLEAQRRSRELGYLRTLGVTEPQMAGLAAVQHGLPILVAVVVGLGLGLGLAVALEPGLGLAAFIGPDAPTAVRLQVDWPSLAAVVVTVVVVVGLAITVSVWLAGRAQLGRVVRIGEE